jgi:hypothetical protein
MVNDQLFSAASGVRRFLLEMPEVSDGGPVRVKRVGLTINPALPVYPDQRTSSDPTAWSGLCHKATLACLFDHIVRAGEQRPAA